MQNTKIFHNLRVFFYFLSRKYAVFPTTGHMYVPFLFSLGNTPLPLYCTQFLFYFPGEFVFCFGEFPQRYTFSVPVHIFVSSPPEYTVIQYLFITSVRYLPVLYIQYMFATVQSIEPRINARSKSP